MCERVIILIGFLGALITISSCTDDETQVLLTGEEISYPILEVNDSDVEGTAWFRERSDGSVQVDLFLSGTMDGDLYPAHIHMGNTFSNGAIAFTLNPVEGATGESETVIYTSDGGDQVTYGELLAYDGYIDIHSSETDDALIAHGDIGGDELTGEAEYYQLDKVDDDGASAIVAFKERAGGSTLVEIQYMGSTDVSHPNHIHAGTAATGGGIVIPLNPIEGEWTRTNVSELEDGTSITYEELINFDGHLNIHHSEENMSTILSQGDIGRNEFTGNTSDQYDLDQVDGSGVFGAVRFYERNDNTSMAIVVLDGASANHPAYIYDNNLSDGGSIAISLGDLSEGNNYIEIDQQDDGSSITYDELVNFDGHIKVLESTDEPGNVITQGNIGSNVN